ncbi:MAG: flavin reductase family protein [Phycisphaerales bacterium]|nr:flavin reductase family protein [Phycisphaerales bacterium]MCB9836928.1 flavin reductase family protein [Phycisphaera sp.]
MILDPTELQIAERYKLLIGCIGPRPIAVVSTVSPDGKPNLAPFSFFAGVGSNPMTLLFCPANDEKGQEKDTLANCKQVAEGGTGQFAVCVATESIIRNVVVAAEPLPHGESEYELSGLTPAPCELIAAPRVKESPVCFECETTQVIRTNPGQPAGGNVVMGRVLRVHVDDALVNERMHIDQGGIGLVGRMGGLSYCWTRERFELRPGRASLKGD